MKMNEVRPTSLHSRYVFNGDFKLTYTDSLIYDTRGLAHSLEQSTAKPALKTHQHCMPFFPQALELLPNYRLKCVTLGTFIRSLSPMNQLI